MMHGAEYPIHQRATFLDLIEWKSINAKGSDRYENFSNPRSTINNNGRLNNGTDMRNGDSISGRILTVNTHPFDDSHSVHASTISSDTPTSPLMFHLVRKSSMHAPRVEIPTANQLKVDIYCVGVIMVCTITTGAFASDLFKVEAVAPTGRVVKITGDGQYAALFNTSEIGRWNVGMYYNGQYLDGCHVDVCDPSQIKVRDLKGGIAGIKNTFYVDSTKAGPGELGVDISHSGRYVPTSITTHSPGYNEIAFTPFDSGAYQINVHFNSANVREADMNFFNPDQRQRKVVFVTRVDQHHGYIEVRTSCDWEVDYITGMPLICHVTDSSDVAVYGMETGTVCTYPEMIADCSRVGDGRIDCEVTYNGDRYPCRVVRDKHAIYRVQFKPRGTGTYKVWISYEGHLVKGSPFIQEIVELKKPTVNGAGLFRGVLGKPTSFIVNTRGFPGQLTVSVMGPSKPANIQLEQQRNSTTKATYWPTEKGPHAVHIQMDGKDIEGSPFSALINSPHNVRISSGWQPLLDEKGIIPLRVNMEKHLPFDVSSAGTGELTAEIRGPNGRIPVTIDARNNGMHSVVFFPKEEGKHYIHVSWSGYPLSSSPFLGYATYESGIEDPYQVQLAHVPSQALERYPITSSVISTSIDDPVHSSRDVDSDFYGPNGVARMPTESAYRPQETVNELPENVGTSAKLYTRAKITLKGKSLKVGVVGKPAHFRVDGTRANPGQPRAYLQGVNHTIAVTSEQVGPNMYRCTYVPRKPGAYLLHIRWNNERLKGSPFEVNVVEATVPETVPLNGNPVYGTLNGDQPEKKIEHEKSVPESPYTIDIRERKRTGSVKVWGPGISNGILPYFQSNFWVDTSETGSGKSETGSGEMKIQIVGPEGAFHVKIRKASQKDRIYQCFYNPVKPGIYTLNMLWSGTHIEGSPFTVMLASSLRELQIMEDDFASSVISQRMYQHKPPQKLSMVDVILY